MKEISFKDFTRFTRHKKLNYVFKNIKTGHTKEFTANKFYCNKDYKCKVLNLPYLMLIMETQFYEIDETTFKGVSETSETIFKVVENGKLYNY